MMQDQLSVVISFIPNSAMVGALGIPTHPLRRRDRQHLQLAGIDMRTNRHLIIEHDIDAARDQIVQRRRTALVGHVQHVDAGDGLEQFGDQMRRGTRAG